MRPKKEERQLRYMDFLEEAQEALQEENKQVAIDLIKSRLKEIQQAKNVLKKLESQLTNLLEKEIE